MATPQFISEINQLNQDQFLGVFSNVLEHSPDSAKIAYQKKPFSTVQDLASSFTTYLEELPRNEKLLVLKRHPFLGAKSEMTTDSVLEQTSAGLQSLPETEAEELSRLNTQYYTKFGFPFIICVREANRKQIMDELKKRVANDVETEIDNGIEQVKLIVKHRIFNLIKPNL